MHPPRIVLTQRIALISKATSLVADSITILRGASYGNDTDTELPELTHRDTKAYHSAMMLLECQLESLVEVKEICNWLITGKPNDSGEDGQDEATEDWVAVEGARVIEEVVPMPRSEKKTTRTPKATPAAEEQKKKEEEPAEEEEEMAPTPEPASDHTTEPEDPEPAMLSTVDSMTAPLTLTDPTPAATYVDDSADAPPTDTSEAETLPADASDPVDDFLSQHGTDPTIVDDVGDTLLHTAAAAGTLPVITYLLCHGADPTIENLDGVTPAAAAHVNGHGDAAETLESAIKHAETIHRDAAAGNLDAVQEAIAAHVFLDKTDSKKKTALIHAADAGHAAVVDALLDHGADPALPDRRGHSPLQLACLGGAIDVVTVLLSHGADISQADKRGKCPVHQAAKGGHIPILEVLVGRGVDINARDVFLQTPLHHATIERRKDTVTWLLDHGADPDLTDDNGQTPADIAAEVGNVRTANLLRGLPGDQPSPASSTSSTVSASASHSGSSVIVVPPGMGGSPTPAPARVGGAPTQSILIQGKLWKRGQKFRQWREQYFVLRPEGLSWFPSYEAVDFGDAGKHMIATSDMIRVNNVDDKKKCAFEITTAERTHTIGVENAKKRKQWTSMIHSLNRSIKK